MCLIKIAGREAHSQPSHRKTGSNVSESHLEEVTWKTDKIYPVQASFFAISMVIFTLAKIYAGTSTRPPKDTTAKQNRTALAMTVNTMK